MNSRLYRLYSLASRRVRLIGNHSAYLEAVCLLAAAIDAEPRLESSLADMPDEVRRLRKFVTPKEKKVAS